VREACIRMSLHSLFGGQAWSASVEHRKGLGIQWGKPLWDWRKLTDWIFVLESECWGSGLQERDRVCDNDSVEDI
jgi:hypothetical protein